MDFIISTHIEWTSNKNCTKFRWTIIFYNKIFIHDLSTFGFLGFKTEVF